MATDLAAVGIDVLHERYAVRRERDVEAELLRRHDGLALSIVNRFRGRGEAIEDLEQVGRIALWLALRRFDPDRGLRFSTFATATIAGELKRHLRDRAWLVRPPRDLLERYLAIQATADELERGLARAPTDDELAAATGLSVDEVAEALVAGRARRPASSFDAPVGLGDGLSMYEAIPDDAAQAGFAAAEREVFLVALFDTVPEPARSVLALRYLVNLSQREVARRLGVSERNVSITIDRALERLRVRRGAADFV